MDKCTHEVRMEYWKNIITQCQNRPDGQSAKQWMDANGICEGTYYLWQKRIRQQVYEQMEAEKILLQSAQKTEEITFAELPMPQTKEVSKTNLSEQHIHPAAVRYNFQKSSLKSSVKLYPSKKLRLKKFDSPEFHARSFYRN